MRRLRAGWLTDPGRKRTANEDAVFADPARQVFVVADGLGGLPGGEVASRIAARRIGEALVRLDRTAPSEPEVLAAVRGANRAVLEKAADDPRLADMGTTVVLALGLEDSFLVAHVGDSRAYLLREGRLSALTQDHSVVQELLDAGRITAEAARHHPQRNVVTRILGHGGGGEPDLQTVEARPGDRLLLCSDGLTGVLAESEIEQVLVRFAEPMRCCRELVARANDRGGPDNITVVVVDVPVS
jgi:PPM family protein phosphatase